MEDKIVVRGARTHNLKNITLEIPRNQMVVFTGLSGSGKSSLAFDTIFAEGQRRYVESLSAYARQFLRQMQKPDVDEITGLSPAISIDQKSRSNNPRSTVATITEIYDYLRVLYARVGKPYCLECGHPIERLSKEEIVNFAHDEIGYAVLACEEDKRPLGESTVAILSPVVRGRKGEYYQLLYDLLGKGYTHVRVDRALHDLRKQLILDRHKIHDIDVVVDRVSLEEFKADENSGKERIREGIERALSESDGLVRFSLGDNETLMSEKFSCPRDGFSYPEIEPRLFSFNSPYGACPSCNGLGTAQIYSDEPCRTCQGARLRPESLNVFLGGKEKDKGQNIVDLVSRSIEEAIHFFRTLDLSPRERSISLPLLKEIESRLRFMNDVGIGYLSLNRRASTLSGGEAQRIRLASQLGARLVGALYVLDEPTIGLHPRDNAQLIRTLHNLRDLGNTILVVEHDEETVRASDYLVDIGPGAGVHGGQIVVTGDLKRLLKEKENPTQSLTLDYLRKVREIAIPEARRSKDKGALKIRGGTIHNIKNLSLDIPLGRFVVLSGVSGSGKSSLLHDIVYKNLAHRFDPATRGDAVFHCKVFDGSRNLSRVVLVDQSPIGRTPRSNPATYTGAFTIIRELFSATAEARARGWGPGRFSFNVKGGRCEACEGNGEIAVEMHFLPTVYVPCDVCLGKRFDKDTLDVHYRGKNIHQVLSMTIEAGAAFFEEIPPVYDRLKTLELVGLGYLELGQSATTLSGGEAQRVKIAAELYRRHVQKTIYLLDEPTVGLHYEDVRRLLEILQALVSRGHSLIAIEHNLDFIKCADYLIDMGPSGGSGGGKITVAGTPEEVARHGKSFTASFLKRALTQNKG